MATQFCEHLQEYGELYAQAEAAYLHCNSLVAVILEEGPNPEIVESLNEALEEWLDSGQELRSALVELVAENKVRIPKKKPHASKRHGKSHCSVCRFELPKLSFSEWDIAANGMVSFQGADLLQPKSVA